MSTAVAQMSLEVLGAGPHIAPVRLPHQIIPDDPEQGFDRAREREVDRLTENIEGKDATPRALLKALPIEKQVQIDIPSLRVKLSALLPGDRDLERRARKLAWHLARGRRVRCDWDYVSLSELTPSEHRMSDEDFLALYPAHVQEPTRKGGRPRKYRSAAAQRRGHAERQRRYRERKLLMVPSVTKTTSQLAEK